MYSELSLKLLFLGLKVGSAVESDSCSSREPWFNIQHPSGGSQFSVNSTSGDMTPSSDIYGNRCICGTHYITHDKTFIHKNKWIF